VEINSRRQRFSRKAFTAIEWQQCEVLLSHKKIVSSGGNGRGSCTEVPEYGFVLKVYCYPRPISSFPSICLARLA